MEHLTVLPQELEIEFLQFMHALHLIPAHALDNNPDLMIGEATDDLLALEAAFWTATATQFHTSAECNTGRPHAHNKLGTGH